MHRKFKTLNYSIHSSKKHRQYEPIKSIILLLNTRSRRSVQEMESLALFAHEKCIIFVILFVFVLTTAKTRHLKRNKKHKKTLKTCF